MSVPAAPDLPSPTSQPLSTAQYDLVLYALVLAGLALFASFLYSWTGRDEVSSRYRPAVVASLCTTAVAAVSYAVLVLTWHTGFTLAGDRYVPDPALRSFAATRYADWSVTVPLLTAELLAVCAITGARVRSLRFRTMAAAWLMIATGYLGAQVVDSGRSTGWLITWGLVSTAFYAYLNVALVLAVRRSLGGMGGAAATTLRNAAILLLSVWGAYPVAYAIRLVALGPAWTVTEQLLYSAADVAAKVGFGALIHKVAKLRTAEDVLRGEDTAPEPVWISSVRWSEGVQPTVKGVLDPRTPATPDH